MQLSYGSTMVAHSKCCREERKADPRKHTKETKKIRGVFRVFSWISPSQSRFMQAGARALRYRVEIKVERYRLSLDY